jgi:hypothetical protein
LTTALTPRPASRIPSQRSGQQTPRASVVMSYAGYVGCFVGAGLISGGVVHYPLDPARYTQIAVAGVAVFVAATICNELAITKGSRPTALAVVRLVVASLLLSIGIGMLSGGIQHFMDFPARATFLIPLGLLLSFTAYLLWRGIDLRAGSTLRAGATVVGIAAAAFLGLTQFVDTLETADAESHDHVMPAEDGPAEAPGDVPSVPEGAHDH